MKAKRQISARLVKVASMPSSVTKSLSGLNTAEPTAKRLNRPTPPITIGMRRKRIRSKTQASSTIAGSMAVDVLPPV
ncbi:hypothetical protein D9M72_557210 [compost metagenome]